MSGASVSVSLPDKAGVIALRAAIEELLGLTASHEPILVKSIALHMRRKWQKLYTKYEKTQNGWRCFVHEPSIMIGGGVRHVRALPRDIALPNIAAWIPESQNAIKDRFNKVFSSIKTISTVTTIDVEDPCVDDPCNACSDDDEIAWT